MVKVEKHVEGELTRMNAEAQNRREERKLYNYEMKSIFILKEWSVHRANYLFLLCVFAPLRSFFFNAEAQRRREERNETEIQTETACLLTN
jgi:hypothetical protein